MQRQWHVVAESWRRAHALVKWAGWLLIITLSSSPLVWAGAQAVVNNVQRGSTNMGVNPRVITLTSPVVLSRAYIIASSRTSVSDAANRVTAEITGGGTTITFTSNATTTDISVEWEVVEFLTDTVVQRGVTTMAASGAVSDAAPQVTNLAVTAATLGKTYVLISERYNVTRANEDESWTVRAQLTTATNLQLTRNEASSAVTVAWQVVTFTDTTTTVQSGLVSINAGATTATAAITAVDTTRSFLLMNRRGSSNSGGVEDEYMCWGRFVLLASPPNPANTSNQLLFTRGSNKNKVDICWYVVTLGASSAVDSGTMSMATNVLTQDVTIAAVDMTKAIVYVSIAGGGSDVNRLDEDSISSQLTSTTTLHFERKSSGTQADGVWFVVEFAFNAVAKETMDRDGNGFIDAIKMTAFEPLNDNFTGLTVSVAGYTVLGYSTGNTANDNEFWVLLQESPAPDTGITPNTQITANTTLRGTTSNKLVRVEPAALPPTDKARPVLMSAVWADASGGGVTATDTITLTFSEPVTSLNANAFNVLGLPVTGDTLDTSTIGAQGTPTPSTTILVTLLGDPLLTPGGLYVGTPIAQISAGSPTGVYIIQYGADPLGNSNIYDPTGNFALAQTFGTAVDLGPGVDNVAISWDDLTIAGRIWNIGNSDVAQVYQAFASFPPTGLIARNVGNTRAKFTVSCSGSTAAANAFEMKVDATTPLDGVFELDLGTGPKDIVTKLYSGHNKPFDLRFATPTSLSSGGGVSQDITVTITITKD